MTSQTGSNSESSNPLISLCIPTNGIPEVPTVLKSIYSQGIPDSLFEVIITDNGTNKDYINCLGSFFSKHNNLTYKKTDAVLFQNQIECFRLAKGALIKFVNHRMTMNDGALAKLVEFTKNNLQEKPSVYFSNGNLHLNNLIEHYDNFEQYVSALSYYSSWSGGLAIWKDEFDSVAKNAQFEGLYPHCKVLFYFRKKTSYFIVDSPLFSLIDSNQSNKGNYKLFKAFGVEYPSILLQLYIDGSISIKTLDKLLNDNLNCLAGFYLRFVIKKEACSYDLNDYKDCINVFYSHKRLLAVLIKNYFHFISEKISKFF